MGVNSLPTNDAYIRHGCPRFFHKAIRIYTGGLTLDYTLCVDIRFHKPFPYISMAGKELKMYGWWGWSVGRDRAEVLKSK